MSCNCVVDNAVCKSVYEERRDPRRVSIYRVLLEGFLVMVVEMG